MSNHDPIEVARGINDAFAATPFEVLREVTETTAGVDEARDHLLRLGYPRMAATGDLLDEEIVVGETDIEGASTLTTGVGKGRDAWWRWFRAWFEPWDELSVEASNYETVGDEIVLADAHVEARGEISGAPATLDLTQLWGIRAGKVFRYGIYSSRQAAREAVDPPIEKWGGP